MTDAAEPLNAPWQALAVARDADGIVSLTLNQPERRNALSAVMIDELTRFAAAVNADPTVRAVVLTGAGKVFCAGGDLDWMMAQIKADRPTRMREAKKLALMLNALNTLSAPLIGAVHGGAFGGGVGLAAVCDGVVAADDALFGFTETKLGLIPATISPYVIARMGEGPARRVFFSARLFPAQDAQALGLVARVVPPAELAAAAREDAAPYRHVARGAVARSKALARSLGPRIDEAVIDDTIARLADAWETDEAAEGIAAFLEKRKPAWG